MGLSSLYKTAGQDVAHLKGTVFESMTLLAVSSII